MSAVLYFEGNAEAAKALAPDGKVRLCNAKFFNVGEIETAGLRKRPGLPDAPVMFDRIFVTEGCSRLADIRDTYQAFGVEVEVLGKKAKEAAAKVAKTPRDLGWNLATHPELYVKKYPKGAKVDLALEILAELEG